MTQPVHVIVNPWSSSGRGGRVAPRVEASLRARGIPFALSRTGAPGHAVELAREAVEQGAGRVLAVGGDGTVHEVVNGMLQAERDTPPLAVLPLGTGNDFYRMIGTSRRIDDVLDVLEGGRLRRFDVGRVRWREEARFFVNLLGVGVDVEVLRRRERFRRLKGLVQYLAALLSALATYDPIPLRVRLDGDETLEDETTLTAITVGPSAGGGFLLCPEATPDDGYLDLLFVDALGYLEIVRYLPRVIRGTHAGLPVVRLRRFRTARIEAPGPHPFQFQLDGELVGEPVRRLDVEIVPASLPVLVPGDGA